MWVFNKLRVGDKLRNPIQGEFFTTSAIDSPAQALVRESIQNSLDAKTCSPVRVTITVVADAPPDQAAINKLFSGAWEHFTAQGNGLTDPKPCRGTPCPYMVVEDFNTSGLTGDPLQANPSRDDRNNFFNFFRAEGVSGKGGSELGRWGVGKFVFPRSSRASTHFAVTVRDGDRRRLLMGAVTLKGHYVEGQPGLFTPDGLYGVQRDDGLVLPFEETEQVGALAQLFGLHRSHEPGTSIVVPFIDPEDFTFDALVGAVIRSYFAPILAGDLEVTIRRDGREATLQSATLTQQLEENTNLAADLLPLVSLAQAAAATSDSERVVLEMPDPARSAKWSLALLGAGALQRLSQGLDARKPVAVRVPVTVRSKSEGDVPSYFDIYLQADRHCNERPIFVRQGIIISGVKPPRVREVRSIVIVHDQPLAAMLGNSENPAHTEWQRDGAKFKGRYIYGKGLIDFVSGSVGALLALVSEASEQSDTSLTADFFSVAPIAAPADATEASGQKSRLQHGTGPDRGAPKVAPRPPRIAIHHTQTGFTVMPGAAPPPTPYFVEVRCAYEIHGGNPLKKWSADDFKLQAGGLPVRVEGAARIITQGANRLFVRVDGTDFRVDVDGFDTDRDVYVRADVREVGDADSQA